MLMVVEDRRCARASRSGWTRWLPPIESSSRACSQAIRAGFALLSLALVSGFVFVTDLFAQHLLHKTVLAILAWVVFAVLLIGRARLGWRGRKAAGLTLAGFVLLVLSYFGTKFVLEVLLSGTGADPPLRHDPAPRSPPSAIVALLVLLRVLLELGRRR